MKGRMMGASLGLGVDTAGTCSQPGGETGPEAAKRRVQLTEAPVGEPPPLPKLHEATRGADQRGGPALSRTGAVEGQNGRPNCDLNLGSANRAAKKAAGAIQVSRREARLVKAGAHQHALALTVVSATPAGTCVMFRSLESQRRSQSATGKSEEHLRAMERMGDFARGMLAPPRRSRPTTFEAVRWSRRILSPAMLRCLVAHRHLLLHRCKCSLSCSPAGCQLHTPTLPSPLALPLHGTKSNSPAARYEARAAILMTTPASSMGLFHTLSCREGDSQIRPLDFCKARPGAGTSPAPEAANRSARRHSREQQGATDLIHVRKFGRATQLLHHQAFAAFG